MAKRKTNWFHRKPSAKRAKVLRAEGPPPPAKTPENVEEPEAPPKPCPCGYYCGYFFLRCDNCHRGCHFQCLRMKRIEADLLNVFVCQACKDDGVEEAEVEKRSRKEKKPRAVVYEVLCNFHPEDKDGEVLCMPLGHLPRVCPLKNDDCCLCGKECKFEHVFCEHCKCYFHCMCEGLAEEDVKAIADYFCKECRLKRPSLQITYKDADDYAAEEQEEDALGGVDIQGPSGTQSEPTARRGRRDAPTHSGHQPSKGMRREVKEEPSAEGVSSALFPPVLINCAGTHASLAAPGGKVASSPQPAGCGTPEQAPSAKRADAPLAIARPASGTRVKSEDDRVVVIDDDDDEPPGAHAAAPKVSVAIVVRGQGTVSPAMNSPFIRDAQSSGSSEQTHRTSRPTPSSETETRVKTEEPPEQDEPALEPQPSPAPGHHEPSAQAPQVKAEDEAHTPVPASSAEAGENVAQEPVAVSPPEGLYERQRQEKEKEADALRQQLREKEASLETERAARAQAEQEVAHLKQEIEKHKETIVKLTMERLEMRSSK